MDRRHRARLPPLSPPQILTKHADPAQTHESKKKQNTRHMYMFDCSDEEKKHTLTPSLFSPRTLGHGRAGKQQEAGLSQQSGACKNSAEISDRGFGSNKLLAREPGYNWPQSAQSIKYEVFAVSVSDL